MTTHDQVNQLLDKWEDLCESGSRFSLDEFVDQKLQRIDRVVIEAFRRKVVQLAAIDRRLAQVAVVPAGCDLPPTPSTPAAHSTSDGNLCFTMGDQPIKPETPSVHLSLSHIQPGIEPIPGYTLVSRLGRGGFGEVWKAGSPGGFHVALKFVPLGGRVGEVEERSLDVMKDVRHPNLLSVFGTWRIGDLLIIATELADCTLLDRLQEALKAGHAGVPRNELHRYIAEAAKGIDALNDPGKSGRKRIQHRDIKPQNLLLSGGSVKVGDFGLARLIQHDVTGHTGSLTFAYAAPECFDGTTSNHSDQYSLAITYCHLRGGRLPFEGTPVDVMEGHRKQPPDLSMLPAEERPAVAKALAKLPNARWKSCSEFVQNLTASPDLMLSATSDSPLLATIRSPLAAAPRWLTLGAAAVVFILLIGVPLLFFAGDKWKPDTESATSSLPFVRYEITEANVPRFPGDEKQYALTATIDVKRYQKFVSNLESELTPMSRSTGACVLGLPSKEGWTKDGIIEYGGTSPAALSDAIHRSLGHGHSAVPEGCVILIGQRIQKQAWGKQDPGSLRDFNGGDDVLTAKWFWVSQSAAESVAMAFRRARTTEINLSNGETPLTVIRPLNGVRDRIHQGTSFLPGGPVGFIYNKGMGGGQLSTTGALNFYEGTFRNQSKMGSSEVTLKDVPFLEQERVLMVMPGFLVEGVFVEQAQIAIFGASTVNSSNLNQIGIHWQESSH